jgi:DNA polymerase-3 subunit delta
VAHTYASLLEGFSKGVFPPVIVVGGAESFFIDALTDRLSATALTEDEKAFNASVLYGRDVAAADVVSEARRYPMMAERVLVVVREAQNLKDFDALSAYFKSPNPTTVLCLAFKGKTPDKRREGYKTLLAQNHAYIEAVPLNEGQAKAWIKSETTRRVLKTDDHAVSLLYESVGADLNRLAHELDKLAVALGEGGMVTPAEIEKHVGISREFNNLELIRALVNKDVPRVYRIAHGLSLQTKTTPLPMTLGFLYATFGKALVYSSLRHLGSAQAGAAMGQKNPYALRDYETICTKYSSVKLVRIVRYLREADLAFKGVRTGGAHPDELLRELLFKIVV